MNIYIELFFTFLKIGTFSFGGGYGMISVIREQCLLYGWLTEEELINFIAVSESTPGPIAVNMATFIGSSQGGMLGSFVATLGVVLPSFIIILLIASVMSNLIKYGVVKAGLDAVQPVIIGLIIITGITMIMSILFGLSNINSKFDFDYKSLIILAIIIIISFVFKQVCKKDISPIVIIIFSAILGVIMFGIVK